MYSVLNCHNVAKHGVLPEIVTVQCDFHWQCRMFKKELYSDIPNVTVTSVTKTVYT
jgi:hypothetical protein